MRRTAFLFALIAVFVGCGWLAAAKNPIIGAWECTATSPDGNESHMTMNVKEDAGKLVAVAVFENGELKLAEPKFESGTFSFKATLDSGTYEVKMKLSGNKLKGTYKGAEASGPIKGFRKT